MKLEQLTAAGREELALALLFWKDFKSDNQLNVAVTLQMFQFAEMLGVKAELEALLSKIPPVKIVPRY